MLRLLLDAAIIVVIEETARQFIPKLLRHAWMLIACIATWEIRGYAKDFALEIFKMAKDKNLVGLSYFAVAVLGAMVFTFYWWGIGKALTALAASKQAASQSQPEVVTLLQLFKTDFTGGKDQICAELAPSNAYRI